MTLLLRRSASVMAGESAVSRRVGPWALFFLVSLVVLAGCSRSPEAQKARHLERGDKYIAREQYREAILEYRNVLRLDSANARAIRELGLAHYRLGEMAQAFRYLLKAQETNPDDSDVRLKIGGIYLLAGRQAEAREEAEAVLGREPKNLDALALLADASLTPEEVDAAIGRLDQARLTLGDQAKLQLALGALYFRRGDPAGAERAFQEAAAREPKSVEAHSFLGSLYLARRDVAKAEQELKIASNLAPVGSPARLRLADFYLSAQRPDEAKRILIEMTQKAPDFLPAWRRLALLEIQQRNYDESLKTLQALLKKNPADVEGQFQQGRVRLAKRETNEAIQNFQNVLKLEPRSAPAHYQLALAHLQAGNIQQAKAELKEAISTAPNFAEAVLTLAQLNLETAALQPAIGDLEGFLARQPKSFRATMLLGSAYMAKGEPAKATESFRKLLALAPQDPRGPYLVGLGLRAQGKLEDARKQFEAALALAPAYVDPLSQLVAMDVAAKQPDAALARVTKQTTLAPKSGGLQWLLGTVYLDRREPGKAEGAFLKAIDLEPTRIDPYVRLAQLYMSSRRYEQALTKLNDALRVDPWSLPAQMQLGVVYQTMSDVSRAQEVYEKLLAQNPRFAPAANNLAEIYAEYGGDTEKALELAQRAKEVAPDDPHISDTLGWILYKRGVYRRAVDLLKESATKLPDSPVVQYHLGLASLKVGDTAGARKALTAAVRSPSDFAGKDEAERTLAELK